MKTLRLVSVVASCLLSLGLLAAQDETDDPEGGDDLSLMLDIDDMDAKSVRALADRMLKKPGGFSAEAAIRVIAHPNLNDARTAEILYRLYRPKVKPGDFDALADSPVLREGFSDPVVAGLLIRLVGLTRNPRAKPVILDAFRRGDPAYKAAAAHAIGLFGDRTQLPTLQKEFDRVTNEGSTQQNAEYVDGLVRGMLHLGDARHLPRLISETAAAAKTVAGTVLTIASGYTPPRERFLCQKRLPGMRQRHQALTFDIVEIAPLFPKELAQQVTEATDPDVCDVLYRSLPGLVTETDYKAFVPALRARCWDLRQLTLDLLMAGKAKEEDLPEIRKTVLEWYEGKDRVGRTWAVRNLWALDKEMRRKMLLETLKSGSRWEQVEAVREIRREPDEGLLAAARDLAARTRDPDVLLNLNRFLVARSSP